MKKSDLVHEQIQQLRKSYFSQGYFCACAVLVQQHGESTMVEDMFKQNFMTIDEMRSIGVDMHDIQVLEPIVLEIERKRQLQ